jgi:pyridoxal phosphate enzyme (YggS family)
MTCFSQRLGAVNARIANACKDFGRDPATIRLLAVSKRHPLSAIREALEAGQTDFGENFVQEGVGKIEALGESPAHWHFIGPSQSNKTALVAANFGWVHSIDRFKIARRLSEQRPYHAPPLNLCIQVALAEESGKSGATPDGLQALAEAIHELPRIRLRGLMAIPPPSSDQEVQRGYFRRLRELRDTLVDGGIDLDTLSMGMSADLEAAIAEGATIVRVGTALFGPRPASPDW